jgi:hypothetical protein
MTGAKTLRGLYCEECRVLVKRWQMQGYKVKQKMKRGVV